MFFQLQWILTLLIALTLLPNKITFRDGIGSVYMAVLLCELFAWNYVPVCTFILRWTCRAILTSSHLNRMKYELTHQHPTGGKCLSVVTMGMVCLQRPQEVSAGL